MSKRAPTSLMYKVYQANKGLIAKILHRYSIQQLDIADIMQETILRALEAEKRTEIREPRKFLIGITKNIARNELQRQSKMIQTLLDDFDPQMYISDEPAVDDIVDKRHRMDIFGKVLLTLPPQCQKVFVLKHIYGASHKEIARKLDIAVSTVEKHVALGLRLSRERIIDELSENGIESEANTKGSVLGLENALNKDLPKSQVRKSR